MYVDDTFSYLRYRPPPCPRPQAGHTHSVSFPSTLDGNWSRTVCAGILQSTVSRLLLSPSLAPFFSHSLAQRNPRGRQTQLGSISPTAR